MKKALSLILAVMMLLGCMSITVFAEEPKNITAITATKQAVEEPEPEVVPVSYEMVIPAAVTITEAGVKEIGAPAVKNVQNAEDNTVISYVATGTQLTLKDSDKTMATTYYKAYTSRVNYTLLTSDPIVVYQNKDAVNPLTKLYVGVSKSAWDAAEAGTYAATVTFNFSAGGAPCPVSMEGGTVIRVIRKGAETLIAQYYDQVKYDQLTGQYKLLFTAYDASANLYVSFGNMSYAGDMLGADYQVGDYYHLVGDNYVKCINPETHQFDTTIGQGIFVELRIFSPGQDLSSKPLPVTHCLQSGTKCVVTEDGKLQALIPGSEPKTLGGEPYETMTGVIYQYEWYFNGTEAKDKIGCGFEFEVEDGDVLTAKWVVINEGN